MNPSPITEADLHAYVDRQLSAARRAEIDAYLASRPAEAQRLQAYQEQNEALRALFDPVLAEALPARLAVVPPATPWHRGRLAAGIVAGLASGLIGGWFLRGTVAPAPSLAGAPAATVDANSGSVANSLPRRAAVAHAVFSPDVRRPVEVAAEHEDQLVAWLSKRLGERIRAPKLAGVGYELVGGRLLPGASAPVAQFMYQDATGQKLTLYVSNENAANRDTGFRFAQEGQVNVFYWIDGKFGYALSAGIDKAELGRIAHAVYAQLQAP